MEFEAYNRLQAAAVAFGETLPIPEIVAIGGQSDGKSSLLEGLLGFRFNVRDVEMGTRRPLIVQMVHDVSALEPRCSFQDEDSEEYGNPIVSATAVADVIRSRTEALLRKTKTAVSPKPIVMRAEYAHSPNLTIIDTPGFVLKAKIGEPETTPDEILSMVKSLASPPHRIILFLQQSSVEWCSSLWLDAVREIDSSFRRTIVVVSKFDNRLKEFNDRGEVDRYLSASGYLGEDTRPYFVALPKDGNTVSNHEFRRQISQMDTDVIRHLREGVKGGFDEEKFRSHIGFGSLRDFLQSELQKRYTDAAPATLALLQQRCSEVSDDVRIIDMKIQATSDVAHLRKAAMLYMASLCNHVGALIDGAANPAPEQWGKTTEEERRESGIGSWPSCRESDIKPPNAVLRLYGGAAFERVLHEFRCAAYSIDCPPISRENVANILLAHAGRGGGRGVTEASAEIARTAVRSWLAPLLDTACDRLAFVLGSLFEIALERNLNQNSEYENKAEYIDGCVGFHAALRNCYTLFVKNLAKQCKQLVRHHLDSVTSPYSMACYEMDYHQGGAFGSYYIELSDTGRDEPMKDKENTPSEKSKKAQEIIVPETPSPDQPGKTGYSLMKKEIDNGRHHDGGGARKGVASVGGNRSIEPFRIQNEGGGLLFGNGMKSRSAYSEICSSAAQQFARMREVLVERRVTSTLNSGFLAPCRDRLVIALGVDLFAVNDEKFMDMLVAPGAIDVLQKERQQLQKRLEILQSCLSEFKTVSRSL
ncbi:unnamed protein product [Eruca vesicaria subsp. sativa]|uniref:Dynamin-type G domain-containing protein n=1 Tax=Eruca vesicaria subsp. sativa TaxID=29727 RepID=A0ABC8J8U8_ERUVS|nr:unnamed protein product [Eruca vesicaria subsp. sativa]